ncbi:uncharacterized protein SCHCODRAFT_02303748 [Schizophyllum commune H4-8]|uniref:uncharacterized protein n=1 Tax=Schizophyllum commune (strain H4-8 / FGSC 9210) TaxID=578458 RepID=UPI00216071D3|nr:uncharacterized protein SCHCODRAFT_02303748 [Schizophyllum commune H4-8]KAI5892881.1 hypothetical protein SCHCODRAFT_02303748 [Schizophyllum commune H4-8]
MFLWGIDDAVRGKGRGNSTLRRVWRRAGASYAGYHVGQQCAPPRLESNLNAMHHMGGAPTMARQSTSNAPILQHFGVKRACPRCLPPGKRAREKERPVAPRNCIVKQKIHVLGLAHGEAGRLSGRGWAGGAPSSCEERPSLSVPNAKSSLANSLGLNGTHSRALI